MIELYNLIPFGLAAGFIGTAQWMIQKWNGSYSSDTSCELSHSGISNSYSSTKRVFQTLEEANIPPCFLEAADDTE